MSISPEVVLVQIMLHMARTNREDTSEHIYPCSDHLGTLKYIRESQGYHSVVSYSIGVTVTVDPIPFALQ